MATQETPPEPTPRPDADEGRTRGSAPMQARVTRPYSEAIVLTVSGEVDAASVDRLEHTLWPRLTAQVRVIVVDLTGVPFLGVPGLRLLYQAYLRARESGIILRVVSGGHEIEHALRRAGLDAALADYSSVQAALSD